MGGVLKYLASIFRSGGGIAKTGIVAGADIAKTGIVAGADVVKARPILSAGAAIATGVVANEYMNPTDPNAPQESHVGNNIKSGFKAVREGLGYDGKPQNGAGKSMADTAKDLGLSFGIGSIVAAVGGYLTGHFLLDSPALGMGLAAVAAIVGEPILRAVMGNETVAPITPASGVQPQQGTAPEPEKKPEIVIDMPVVAPVTPQVTAPAKTGPAASTSTPSM
jgi:hypothetical protein